MQISSEATRNVSEKKAETNKNSNILLSDYIRAIKKLDEQWVGQRVLDMFEKSFAILRLTWCGFSCIFSRNSQVEKCNLNNFFLCVLRLPWRRNIIDSWSDKL